MFYGTLNCLIPGSGNQHETHGLKLTERYEKPLQYHFENTNKAIRFQDHVNENYIHVKIGLKKIKDT